jgi:hypothetical protein
MPQPNPHRWPARRFFFAARSDRGRHPLDILRKRMAPVTITPEFLSPLAPAELRAEVPGPDGIRHGLVNYYRDLIAKGELDTPERLEAAQDRMFDTILGSR